MKKRLKEMEEEKPKSKKKWGLFKDTRDSGEGKQSTVDMAQFVQTLLQQMQVRFRTMSEPFVSKIDEMGGRIGELEQSINDLI